MEEKSGCKAVSELAERLDGMFDGASEAAVSFVSGYMAAATYFMVGKGIDEVPDDLEGNLRLSLAVYVLGSAGMGEHVDRAVEKIAGR